MTSPFSRMMYLISNGVKETLELTWRRESLVQRIFSHSRIFSKSPYKTFVIALRYIISLYHSLLSLISPNHNPELRGVICTGVRPFSCTDMLPLISNALLSANKNRVINLFTCITKTITAFKSHMALAAMYLQILKTQNYIFPNLVFSLKIKFHKFQSRHYNTFSLKEERAYSLKLHALILKHRCGSL